MQLRIWLIGKLMRNPQLNQEQLTNEFLQGYYGAAAPYLKQASVKEGRDFLVSSDSAQAMTEFIRPLTKVEDEEHASF